MSKTNNTYIAIWVIIFLLALFGCENAAPTGGNTEAQVITQGQSLDQLDVVDWSPEVIRSIRALPDFDESGQILTKKSDPRPGVDVQEIDWNDGGLVGGENTFGNAVYIPDDALTQDKFIAVQVACTDADLVALFADGEAYMQMIQSDLTSLLASLESDLEQADNNDDFEYNERDIDRAINDVEDAQDAIYENAIYFQLYSYYAQERAFSHMEHVIAREMKHLAIDVDRDEINPIYLDTIRNISILTVDAVRSLAIASIEYASQNPEADQNKIEAAWDRIAQGDFVGDYDFSQIDGEWDYYDMATNRYKQAWKFAGQAIHNLDTPCGAMVDFLPSQQFEADVYVTLSWEALNFQGDPDLLEIHWFNEETGLWVLVPDPVIDYDAGTVSVYIDHFTRYAWSTRPPPSGD